MKRCGVLGNRRVAESFVVVYWILFRNTWNMCGWVEWISVEHGRLHMLGENRSEASTLRLRHSRTAQMGTGYQVILPLNHPRTLFDYAPSGALHRWVDGMLDGKGRKRKVRLCTLLVKGADGVEVGEFSSVFNHDRKPSYPPFSAIKIWKYWSFATNIMR